MGTSSRYSLLHFYSIPFHSFADNTILTYLFLVADQVDVTGHVKVYVAPVPRTASEADVSHVTLFFSHSLLSNSAITLPRASTVIGRNHYCYTILFTVVKVAIAAESNSAITPLFSTIYINDLCI